MKNSIKKTRNRGGIFIISGILGFFLILIKKAKNRGKILLIPGTLGFLLILTLLYVQVIAQHNQKADISPKGQFSPASLKEKISQDFNYAVDKNTGKITFLAIKNESQSLPVGEAPKENVTPASLAIEFIGEYGGYFGLNNPKEELMLAQEKKDQVGKSHLFYDQKYKGIKVFAGQIAVHIKDNKLISSANGRVVPNVDLDTNSKISKDEAITKAKESWNKKFKISEAKVLNSELMVFNKGIIQNNKDNQNYLVYEVELYQAPVGHEYYYINAKDGSLVYQITGSYNLTRNIYDCSIYPWVTDCGLDTLASGHTYGRSEGRPINGINPLVTYAFTDVDNLYNIIDFANSYFATKFSRNGANNQGGIGDGVYSAVTNTDGWTYLDYYPNSDEIIGCPNAFFDGFSVNFCQGLVYADVVGHEYSHGVVDFSISGGLTYENESGALHEAYADIFGAAIENYQTGSGNWLMGEDINVPDMVGPLRSLENPGSYGDFAGYNPDTFYSSSFYCGAEDIGGVHHNSTVVSHAAYLMAQGGIKNNCTIEALGRDKMERIFYQAVTNYFTTNTDFNGAYNALNSGCSDLYGASSIECSATMKALQVVEINQAGACSTEARVEPACGDSTAPSIANQNPAGSATNISKDTDIYFEIKDSSSGVNSSTINVTINNIAAILNGVLQSGYSGSISDDGSGGYNITINPSSDFEKNALIGVEVNVSDNSGNAVTLSWSFTIKSITLDPKILTTSGPGEITRLQAYDRQGNVLGLERNDLFPRNYLGGAGIIPIDANNNGLKDQMIVFAASNGGPQARIFGLKSNISMTFFGQMFVFDSKIRDGLSMTSGDFDNDGFQDDIAACLTGDRRPNVRVYRDVRGVDNWQKIGDFTASFGSVGCNLGTFQYDDGADEILVTPNHASASPNVYIYTVSGTLKKQFAAYASGVQSGLTASGIDDRIYTTPNNGSSHVMVYDKNGSRKAFWWAYQKHVRGNFKNVPGDIDLDGIDEILISPIGKNGPHVMSFERTGTKRAWPNFFAFGDKTLRNGVGIAVIDNFHEAN